MSIDHRSTVQQFMSQIDDARKQLRFVLASQRGEAVMQEMMKGDHHLCAVIKFSYGRYRIVGLITFEDVLEEVFGDIEDDSDKMWNNRRAGVHKDQQTLDWFRTSEAEQSTGLGVNATLRLIQSIFDCCPLLVTLGYDVLRMKGLLSADKLKYAEEDQVILPKSDRKVLIFFSGTVTVENGKKTTYRLEANRADFMPYVCGKSLIKRIFKERLQSLSCLREPLGVRTRPNWPTIRAITKTAYFEITASNILNGLRDPDDVGYEYNLMLATPPSVTTDGSVMGPQGNEVYEPDSTQETSPLPEKRLHTTPKRSSENVFHRVLTPRRLRAQLMKLKSFSDGSKEFLSPDNTGSDKRPVIKKSSKEVPKTAREPVIRTGPPSKPRANSYERIKQGGAARPRISKTADKNRKNEAPLSITGSSEVSKELEKDRKMKSAEVVVVPSATNLNQGSEPPMASTPKKKFSIMSFLKRKNQ